jgi:uncharacterized protein (TIGR03437 family)
LKILVFASMIVATSGARLALAQTSDVANLAASGNGQVACICFGPTLQAFQPISVTATDVNGNPVGGATVTWTVTSGQVTLGSSTSITGGNGVTPPQTISIGGFVNVAGAIPYLVSTIQATSNNSTVVFTETQSLVANGVSAIKANPPTLNGASLGNSTLSADVGTTLSTPIQVFVGGYGTASDGVANVSVRILNEQSSPALTCSSNAQGTNGGGYADVGSVLTPSQGVNTTQGIANCYPTFGGSGPGTYYVLIGGMPGTDINSALYLQAYGPYNFNSIAGAPAAVQIVSGNNQVGAIGQQLQPLVAKLVDAKGNPVQGQTMVWSVIPAGAVGLSNTNPVTDNNGEVFITVDLDLLASSGAAITVALQSNSNISATFQETVKGALTAMNYISGNGQSAQVGTNFSLPLVVQLVNGSGPVTGYPVQYLVSGQVSLVGGTTVGTNSLGDASVTVMAGNLPGTATVTAVAGALTYSFTLTITTSATAPPPNGLSIISGNSQTAIVGATFTQPLIVQVNSTAGPVQGYTVNFSTSGQFSLSGATATTNSSGQASITVTAGVSPGTGTVTASVSGFSVTFNLTITPSGPQISPSSFLNAASRAVGQLSPCSLAILTAEGLTPDAGIADLTTGPIFGRYPKSVNNLSVIFGGVPAPILRVAMGATYPEVTLQVPCEVTPGSSVPVVVNINGGGTATANIPIAVVSPGIFQQVMSDGVSRAVALRGDGSFADIGGSDGYDLPNPVRQGEYTRFYLTGLGATNPQVGTDGIEDPNSYVSSPTNPAGVESLVAGTVQAGFPGSNASVQVVAAHAAPGLIGVYEVEVLIPTNAPTGDNVPISIGIVPFGSSSSTPGTFGPNSVVPIEQ